MYSIFQQADNFTNSLGVLQQFANPKTFRDFGNRNQEPEQLNEGTAHYNITTLTGFFWSHKKSELSAYVTQIQKNLKNLI